jgi:hypothetical protein
MFDRGCPYKDQLEQRNHSNLQIQSRSYGQNNIRPKISDN